MSAQLNEKLETKSKEKGEIGRCISTLRTKKTQQKSVPQILDHSSQKIKYSY